MFIFLNALVASLDGLVIGYCLKLAKTKISIKNILIFILTNFIIYSIVIITYYLFHLKFMTTGITTFLYLLLAYHTYKEKENNNCIQNLTIFKTIMLSFTHSLDGSIVSLNFVYNYNLLYIIFLFTINSIGLLLLGYYFANFFKNIKNSNLLCAILFIFLAILNLIF